MRDPDGNFVELSQPAELPSSAPPNANVIGVRVRLAVADAAAAARLYQNELGLQQRAPLGDFGNNDAVLRALGLTGGRYRVAQQNVPSSGLMYDFVDFDGVEQTMGVLGDVEHCRARLRQIVSELNPGRVITWFDFGGRVPHAQVLESMQLFSEAILPEWRAQSA